MCGVAGAAALLGGVVLLSTTSSGRLPRSWKGLEALGFGREEAGGKDQDPGLGGREAAVMSWRP